jgi:hypothetical protein
MMKAMRILMWLLLLSVLWTPFGVVYCSISPSRVSLIRRPLSIPRCRGGLDQVYHRVIETTGAATEILSSVILLIQLQASTRRSSPEYSLTFPRRSRLGTRDNYHFCNHRQFSLGYDMEELHAKSRNLAEEPVGGIQNHSPARARACREV